VKFIKPSGFGFKRRFFVYTQSASKFGTLTSSPAGEN